MVESGGASGSEPVGGGGNSIGGRVGSGATAQEVKVASNLKK